MPSGELPRLAKIRTGKLQKRVWMYEFFRSICSLCTAVKRSKTAAALITPMLACVAVIAREARGSSTAVVVSTIISCAAPRRFPRFADWPQFGLGRLVKPDNYRGEALSFRSTCTLPDIESYSLLYSYCSVHEGHKQRREYTEDMKHKIAVHTAVLVQVHV